MDLIQRFQALLEAQKNAPSANTVKNYVADIRNFISWFDTTHKKPFELQDFKPEVIELYKNQSQHSEATIERRIASLKKLSLLLGAPEATISALHTSAHSTSEQKDLWKIGEFKHFLRKEKSSPATIKNYLADISSFKKWHEATYPEGIHTLNAETVIGSYRDAMIHVLGLSPASVNRRLSSLKKYQTFGELAGVFTTKEQEKSGHLENSTDNFVPKTTENMGTKSLSSLDAFRVIHDRKSSPIAPVRLLNTVAGPYTHLEERTAFHIADFTKRIQRSIPTFKIDSHNLFKPCLKLVNLYQNNTVFRITTVSLFFLILTASGTIGYMKFYYQPRISEEILGIQNANTRVLSYSGTLTNTDGSPITIPTSIGFKLYAAEQGSTYFWHEQHTVTPNASGTFAVTLGSRTDLPANLLTENQNVFLGVQVGSGPELTPRQPIANVGYALNAKNFQGMSPITQDPNNTSNVVLALDSSGNLSIGGMANPIFQATGGDFMIRGQSVTLTTNSGSNGNIVLKTDGLGVIDMQSPIANTSEPSASESGAVEFADDVIIASDSATSLLSLDNTGEVGDILRLFSRNTARMVVDNSGNVGIGTTTPSQLVHLAHSASPTLRLENLASGNILDIASLTSSAIIGTNQNHALGFKTNNLTRMSIQPNGNVGIGTLNAQALLDVAGDVHIGGNLTLTGSSRNIQTADNTNLILGGNTTGNIILQPLNGAGNLGIGNTNPEYAFDLHATHESKPAAFIYNASTTSESDGLTIKLGNNTKTNQFLTFQTHNSGYAGSISANGSEGIEIVSNDTADFAEYLKKNESESIPFGSLICIAQNNTVTRCSDVERNIIGVASERPTLLGGKNLGNKSVAVGLVGVVETFVSTTQGQIRSGDPISISSTAGVGTKASGSGFIAGRALESLSSGTGKIKVLVQPTWFDSNIGLATSGELITTEIPEFELDSAIYQHVTEAISQSYVVTKRENSLVKTVSTYAGATIGKIKTGVLEAQSAVVRGTLASSKIITEQLIVTSDNVSIDGKPLSEYIAGILPRNDFQSPRVQAEQMSTQFISPLADAQDVAIQFVDDAVVIGKKSASDSAGVVLGADGDGTFSGDINASNASISGTLSADTIKANTIDGLDEKVSTLASQYLSNAATQTTPSFSTSNWNTDGGSYVDIASVSASFGLFHDNLLSLGTTTLREASVMDTLSIGGTMTMGSDSLNVLGSDLHVQPLRQGGISFLSGLVAIDQQGNLAVGGDASFAKNVTVSGGLFANIISPLPDQDLDILLGDKTNGDKTSLNIKNGSKTSVFSVFNTGDVYSSGSAHFAGDLIASGSALISKLNIFSQDAQAGADGSVSANSSAGTATLPAYKKEITIKSPHADGDSLIYITPSTNTNNQVLYLMRQSADGSFTVGIAEPLSQPIEFNWIIVN